MKTGMGLEWGWKTRERRVEFPEEGMSGGRIESMQMSEDLMVL